MSRREKRLARTISLQVIYAQELSGAEPGSTIPVIVDDFEDTPPSEVIAYSGKLARLTIDHSEEMDDLITHRSKNWDISRISLMDRLILRMSLAEMIYEEDIPPKVSIAEGVEIAKVFSTDESSGFVNGILDSVYNDLLKGKIKFEK
jgi:N utilization substance protein B